MSDQSNKAVSVGDVITARGYGEDKPMVVIDVNPIQAGGLRENEGIEEIRLAGTVLTSEVEIIEHWELERVFGAMIRYYEHTRQQPELREELLSMLNENFEKPPQQIV